MYWGDYSQIESVLQLLKRSTINNYKYYHLLSGADLPIKTQDYIHDFFRRNDGKEFIGFDDSYDRWWAVEKFHLLTRYLRPQNALEKLLKRYVHDTFLTAQCNLKYTRANKYQLTIMKGSDWYSISHDFARFIISNEKMIKDSFKYTVAPIELFVHTLVWNSKFKQNIYDLNDEWSGSVRYIDWNRSNDGLHPYVFRNSDFDDLVNSNKLFARKFDENIDREIIDRIYSYIKNGQA